MNKNKCKKCGKFVNYGYWCSGSKNVVFGTIFGIYLFFRWCWVVVIDRDFRLVENDN